MRVTICEFGANDGAVIDIPDGSRFRRVLVQIRPVVTEFIEPRHERRQVDNSIRMRPNPRYNDPFQGPHESPWEMRMYTVEEYRHPDRHDTPFALVSPEFYAASLR